MNIKNKLKLLAIISISSLFVIIILAVVIPFIVTRKPEGCAACHSMKPYYQSWKESRHSVAADHCLDCHVKKGFISKLLFRIYFWKELYAEISQKEIAPSLVIQPTINSCVAWDCHSLNRKYSVNRDIKINHRKHVTQFDLLCTDCHQGVVHQGVEGIGKPLPSEELCFDCHGVSSLDCSYCHQKRYQTGDRKPHH